MRKRITMFFLLAPLFLTLACSHRDNVSYKDDVKKALEQADLKDVTVSENQDKNTITLGGKVHSNDAKAKAEDVAKTAANTRIIANRLSSSKWNRSTVGPRFDLVLAVRWEFQQRVSQRAAVHWRCAHCQLELTLRFWR